MEEDLPTGTRVGNFELVKLLARGGMGTIYEARHPQIGHQVVVKVLTQELNQVPAMAERFISEAKAVARIRHPNVVQIFDFGYVSDRPYYTMELLEGRELSDVFEERERFLPRQVFPYLEQIGGALHAAHETGIVHRDLKPDNIFVLSEDPVDLKLLDFGIAKLKEPKGPNMTVTGMVMGTPRYMAPEQARAESHKVGPHTDIYALGILLYRMLTGRVPFDSEVPVVTMALHIRHDPKPLTEVNAMVPVGVNDLVLRCLAKHPLERPESVMEVVHEYRRAVGTPTQESVAPSAAEVASWTSQPETRPMPPVIKPGPWEKTPSSTEPAAEVVLPTPVDLGRPSSDEEEQAPDPPEPTGDETVSTRPPVAPKKKRPTAEEIRKEAARQAAASEKPVPKKAAPKKAAPKKAAPKKAAPKKAASKGASRAAGKGGATRAAREEAAPAPVSADDRLLHKMAASGAEDKLAIFEDLLRRMKRARDFPAISRSVSEISVKALYTSKASANQLSDSIRTDYSLSTKLLRMVNSALYRWPTGPVKTVSRAVVLMGFDQVRTVTLGLTLFQNMTRKRKATELFEACVSSLMAGGIAMELAAKADFPNPEEAFVCAMYRDIGRHLVLYYLPDLHDEIAELARSKGASDDRASRVVLGISYEELGVFMAQHWSLSERLIESMKSVPQGELERPQSDNERLQAFSNLSNELCELASSVSPRRYQQELAPVLKRYEKAVHLREGEVPKVLKNTSESISDRYSNVLDVDMKYSNFFKQMSRIIDPERTPAPDPLPELLSQRAQALDDNRQELARRRRLALRRFSRRKDTEQVSTLGGARPTLEGVDKIEAITWAVKERVSGAKVLNMILECMQMMFGFKRVLLLYYYEHKGTLQIRLGRGPDVDELRKVLEAPVDRRSSDIFSETLFHNLDRVISDVDHPSVAPDVPQWHRDILGSTALLLYPLVVRNRSVGLLYADAERSSELISSQDLPYLDQLRQLAVKALFKLAKDFRH